MGLAWRARVGKISFDRFQLLQQKGAGMALITRVLALLVLLTACAAVAGCNTVEGLGKDIQSGGKTIQDAAD
jgi:predicted small secreted protein